MFEITIQPNIGAADQANAQLLSRFLDAVPDENQTDDSIIIEDQLIFVNQSPPLTQVIIEDQLLLNANVPEHADDIIEDELLTANQSVPDPQDEDIIEDEILLRAVQPEDTAEIIIVDVIDFGAPVAEPAVAAVAVPSDDSAEFIIIEDQIIGRDKKQDAKTGSQDVAFTVIEDFIVG